jgi:predicted RNA-binding Zn-ribbon protein involved in translation (DUF1610 family)
MPVWFPIQVAVLFCRRFVAGGRNELRARSDRGFECANCGSAVPRYNAAVIVTWECPRCGWRVPDDPGKGKKQLWPDREL